MILAQLHIALQVLTLWSVMQKFSTFHATLRLYILSFFSTISFLQFLFAIFVLQRRVSFVEWNWVCLVLEPMRWAMCVMIAACAVTEKFILVFGISALRMNISQMKWQDMVVCCTILSRDMGYFCARFSVCVCGILLLMMIIVVVVPVRWR